MNNSLENKKIEEFGRELTRIGVKIEIVCKNISENTEDIKEIKEKLVKILEILKEHERRIELLEKNQRWIVSGILCSFGMLLFEIIRKIL